MRSEGQGEGHEVGGGSRPVDATHEVGRGSRPIYGPHEGGRVDDAHGVGPDRLPVGGGQEAAVLVTGEEPREEDALLASECTAGSPGECRQGSGECRRGSGCDGDAGSCGGEHCGTNLVGWDASRVRKCCRRKACEEPLTHSGELCLLQGDNSVELCRCQLGCSSHCMGREKAQQRSGGWALAAGVVRGGVVQPVVGLWQWLARLQGAFGTPFVVAVMVVYGVSEGVTETVSDMASNYFWKDVQKMQPAGTQLYVMLADLPWDIKPLYGLITDSFPLWGRHTRPYLALSACLGLLCWWLLAALPAGPVAATAFLAGTSVSVAAPDVVIDAAVAARSRDEPSLAGDLQSLSWGSLAIGSLIGSALSGGVVQRLGPRLTYGVLSLCPSILLLTALLLPEGRQPDGDQKSGASRLLTSLRLFICTVRLPSIWRPALYLYLSQALAPDISEAKFFWYTDDTGAGLNFSPQFVGFIMTFGYVGVLVGVAVFNCYLKDKPYRLMFMGAQIFVFCTGLLDLVLVTRVNRLLSVPDHAFVIGDEAMGDAIDMLRTLPMQVLAARMCPPGIEGTLFAFLMSLQNFGSHSSALFGALLLRALGVTRTRYDRLWAAVLIRSLLRLLPIAFLFLVPEADPVTNLAPKIAAVSGGSEIGEDLALLEVGQLNGDDSEGDVSERLGRGATSIGTRVGDERRDSGGDSGAGREGPVVVARGKPLAERWGGRLRGNGS